MDGGTVGWMGRERVEGWKVCAGWRKGNGIAAGPRGSVDRMEDREDNGMPSEGRKEEHWPHQRPPSQPEHVKLGLQKSQNKRIIS